MCSVQLHPSTAWLEEASPSVLGTQCPVPPTEPDGQLMWPLSHLPTGCRSRQLGIPTHRAVMVEGDSREDSLMTGLVEDTALPCWPAAQKQTDSITVFAVLTGLTVIVQLNDLVLFSGDTQVTPR